MDRFEILNIVLLAIGIVGTVGMTIYYQSYATEYTIGDNLRAVLILLSFLYLVYISVAPFRPDQLGSGRQTFSWTMLYDLVGKAGSDGNLTAYYGMLATYFITMGIIMIYWFSGTPVINGLVYTFTIPIGMAMASAAIAIAV